METSVVSVGLTLMPQWYQCVPSRPVSFDDNPICRTFATGYPQLDDADVSFNGLQICGGDWYD
ncbi:MAG: hypothetical protein ACYTAS_07245 [Planctomycetota bacterium]